MKSMRTITNMAIALTTMGGLALAGHSAANAAPSHASVTLNVASWSAAPAEENAVKKLLASFTKKTGIKTNYQVINGDYPTAMKARIASGTLPDIFYLNSDVAQDFIQSGAIHNLDFLKKVKSYQFNQLYAPLVKGFMWKGHVYAIPKDQSTLAVFYNKDMFKAAGISGPPKTEAQFTADACKLTNTSKKIYGAVISNDMARWTPFVYAAGGSVFNKQQTLVKLDNKGARQSLTWYSNLVKKNCAALPSTVGASWNGDAFDKGLAGMVIEGDWLVQPTEQTAPNMHWGVAPLPKGPKGYGNLDFTAAWAMSAKTKHFPQASQLIEFLTNANGEKIWDKDAAYLPARKNVNPKYAGIGGKANVFMREIKYARDWTFPPHGSAMETPINNDLQKVMQGQMSVSAALKDMSTQGTAALNVP